MVLYINNAKLITSAPAAKWDIKILVRPDKNSKKPPDAAPMILLTGLAVSLRAVRRTPRFHPLLMVPTARMAANIPVITPAT